jgi:PAS domain S-box-containing protein
MRSEIVSGKRVKEIPIQLRTKTGKIIDILYSSEIIELGKDMFTISTARDITERNRTEEALRESEERLRTFLNCTADLVFLKDSQSLHIFANKALADFFGRQVEEVIGKSDFELMPPEAARNCRTSDKKALDEKRVIYTEEIAGDRYFETIKFPVPLGEGRKGIGGFIRDITERRQSEERIRAGLEEKEALIREIHHRVKNNLQAMISLMHMRGEDIDDEKTTLFLKELEEQARTMSLVYEQLYQSSSLASVDMESYLRQLSSHVLVAFGSGRSIPINLRAQSMSFDVALAMPCGLITNELLTNSLKYAFPEGIESIPAIDISLERDGNSYVLTVADNGIGLQSGFDWRASRTLGLRLVNLWVTHQLGGTLDITSGGGMSCTIRFEEQERGA